MSDEQHSTLSIRSSHDQEADQKPWKVPLISRALYMKAYKQNDQLTKLERLLILSRCDVPGKALADPDSLTEAERNLVLWRPAPDILAANIRDVTDGAMSTIAELEADHAKSLHWRGLMAIVGNYWTSESRYYNVSTAEFCSEAGRAAMKLIARPSERALQLEALRRLEDPALKTELLAAAGEVDPVSGRLLVKKRTVSSQEREELQSERYDEYLRAKMTLRNEMRGQLEEALEALSGDEFKELLELRRRMVVERDQEKEEDAREEERKAAEGKKEEEELLEAETRKRRARRAARRQQSTAEGDDSDSDSDDSVEGQFPTSEDTW